MLKCQVQSLLIPHESSPINQYVALSIGISTVIPVPTLSAQYLMLSADQSLYLTKENRRNSYVC